MNGSTEILAAYLAAGWTVVRESGHQIVRCPCGKHQTALSRGNHSRDRRARDNYQRAINRCRRGV